MFIGICRKKNLLFLKMQICKKSDSGKIQKSLKIHFCSKLIILSLEFQSITIATVTMYSVLCSVIYKKKYII